MRIRVGPVLGLTLLGAMGVLALAACKSRSPPASRGGTYHATAVTGFYLPLCVGPNVPPFQTIVRVKLHDSLDALIKKGASRQVKYKSGTPATDSEDDDKEYMNSTNNTWLPDPSRVVPYSVDLTSILTDISSPQWVEVKLILPHVLGRPTENLVFGVPSITATSNTSAIPDIPAIVVSDAVTATDMCYMGTYNNGTTLINNMVHINANKNPVAVFYIRAPISTGKPKKLYFNVVLSVVDGIVDTPIIIDPKFMNNG